MSLARHGKSVFNAVSVDLVLMTTLLLGWQGIVAVGKVDAIIAPSPVAVMLDIALHWSTYMQALAITAATVVAGIVMGFVGGAALAAGAWWSTALRGLITPLAALVRATPLVAVLPLLTRMMGYGISTNLAIVSIVVFFPIYVLGSRALRAIPTESWHLFQALGATRWQALRYLAAPGALPGLAVAAKINASLGVLAGFGAEYVTGVGGLGALYANERATFTNPALGWSVAVFSILLAIALSEFVGHVQKRILARFSY